MHGLLERVPGQCRAVYYEVLQGTSRCWEIFHAQKNPSVAKADGLGSLEDVPLGKVLGTETAARILPFLLHQVVVAAEGLIVRRARRSAGRGAKTIGIAP